jgi:hypothetical protein
METTETAKAGCQAIKIVKDVVGTETTSIE